MTNERTADKFKAWRETKPLRRFLNALQRAHAEYKTELQRSDLPIEELPNEPARNYERAPVPGPFAVGIEGSSTVYSTRRSAMQPVAENEVRTAPHPAAGNQEIYATEHHMSGPEDIDEPTAQIMERAIQRARAEMLGEPTLTEDKPAEERTYKPHVVRPERRRYTGRRRRYTGRHRTTRNTPGASNQSKTNDDMGELTYTA